MGSSWGQFSRDVVSGSQIVSGSIHLASPLPWPSKSREGSSRNSSEDFETSLFLFHSSPPPPTSHHYNFSIRFLRSWSLLSLTSTLPFHSHTNSPNILSVPLLLLFPLAFLPPSLTPLLPLLLYWNIELEKREKWKARYRSRAGERRVRRTNPKWRSYWRMSRIPPATFAVRFSMEEPLCPAICAKVTGKIRICGSCLESPAAYSTLLIQ